MTPGLAPRGASTVPLALAALLVLGGLGSLAALAAPMAAQAPSSTAVGETDKDGSASQLLVFPLLADADGDGRDDLLWSRLPAGEDGAEEPRLAHVELRSGASDRVLWAFEAAGGGFPFFDVDGDGVPDLYTGGAGIATFEQPALSTLLLHSGQGGFTAAGNSTIRSGRTGLPIQEATWAFSDREDTTGVGLPFLFGADVGSRVAEESGTSPIGTDRALAWKASAQEQGARAGPAAAATDASASAAFTFLDAAGRILGSASMDHVAVPLGTPDLDLDGRADLLLLESPAPASPQVTAVPAEDGALALSAWTSDAQRLWTFGSQGLQIHAEGIGDLDGDGWTELSVLVLRDDSSLPARVPGLPFVPLGPSFAVDSFLVSGSDGRVLHQFDTSPTRLEALLPFDPDGTDGKAVALRLRLDAQAESVELAPVRIDLAPLWSATTAGFPVNVASQMERFTDMTGDGMADVALVEDSGPGKTVRLLDGRTGAPVYALKLAEDDVVQAVEGMGGAGEQDLVVASVAGATGKGTGEQDLARAYANVTLYTGHDGAARFVVHLRDPALAPFAAGLGAVEASSAGDVTGDGVADLLVRVHEGIREARDDTGQGGDEGRMTTYVIASATGEAVLAVSADSKAAPALGGSAPLAGYVGTVPDDAAPAAGILLVAPFLALAGMRRRRAGP